MVSINLLRTRQFGLQAPLYSEQSLRVPIGRFVYHTERTDSESNDSHSGQERAHNE